MIDHGFAFSGPRWEFVDHPGIGFCRAARNYDSVRGYADFEPWLSRINDFPATILHELWRVVPPEWLEPEGERRELDRLLERLEDRRRLTPDLIRRSKAAGIDPFPNWR
jgi:hypothetical protein